MSGIMITSENFDRTVMQSEKAVLIDFWAGWCGPCRMLAPIIDEIAEEYADTITVGKINVDEQPQLAAALGVESIPTLIAFKNGVPLGALVGLQTKESVIDLITG
ncbi:thioredoxin [Ruminococcus sp. CAG:353]|nr:thioredoxin [Ruminococcus sp. CAG:353]